MAAWADLRKTLARVGERPMGAPRGPGAGASLISDRRTALLWAPILRPAGFFGVEVRIIPAAGPNPVVARPRR
jgi:hypothetical protein